MYSNNDNVNNCECKGSSLKVNKFTYYQFISNITNYNPNYHELGEYINISAKYNCFENMKQKLKSLNVEAYNNYQIECDEKLNECTFSVHILYLKP